MLIIIFCRYKIEIIISSIVSENNYYKLIIIEYSRIMKQYYFPNSMKYGACLNNICAWVCISYVDDICICTPTMYTQTIFEKYAFEFTKKNTSL